MIMLICTKHYLSNISSSIHEKMKQHWAWIEKRLLIKKREIVHGKIHEIFSIPASVWNWFKLYRWSFFFCLFFGQQPIKSSLHQVSSNIYLVIL